jgi:ribosomal protein S12 methylthiotransferase accessory factor
MRAELTPPPHPDSWERRRVSEEEACSRLSSLVDSRVGPITAVDVEPLSEIDGEVGFHATARVQDTSQFADGYGPNPRVTGGTGLRRRRARIAALGEAVERYCLAAYDASRCRRSTADDLSEPAVSPAALTPLNATQLEERGETMTTIERRERLWTAGVDIVSGDRRLVPLIAVYSPFEPTPALHSTTAGAAAGIDYPSAAVRAFCERLEREAVAVGYYGALPFPEVRPETLDGPTRRLLASLGTRGSARVLDATLDGPFPIALVVVQDGESTVALGADCHPDADAAARGAVLEAMQTRSFLRSREFTQRDRPVTTARERAALWSDPARHDALARWFEPAETTELASAPGRTADHLEAIRSFATHRDGDTALVDVTNDPIADRGLRVVKVVSCLLAALPMVERYWPRGRERV